MFCLHLIINMT